LRNQPTYHLFKNTKYALDGLKDIVTHEKSFQIELFLSVILIPFIVFIEVDLYSKLFMIITLMGVLIAETVNSSIERVVDLVTLEHHDMAKRAKDAGSTIVFLSIVLFLVVWSVILYKDFI
jgi:diacylglycerol kinase (ATP)